MRVIQLVRCTLIRYEAQFQFTGPDSQTMFTLEPFDVRAQVYPNEDEYDAILITGSGA